MHTPDNADGAKPKETPYATFVPPPRIEVPPKKRADVVSAV